MNWFNYYGLAIMAIVMMPNIVYAAKHKSSANVYHNTMAEVLEQTGRYGCFVFMIFNIPYTYFNFWFDKALVVYLSVNGGLCLAYLICSLKLHNAGSFNFRGEQFVRAICTACFKRWIICWNRNDKIKALSLSIIPSCIFLFSGIVLADIPLFVFAVIFAVNHILISYRNSF